MVMYNYIEKIIIRKQYIYTTECLVSEHGVRVKRVTCDLLSFQSKWVTPNHSACAAHCLALFKGFKGGRCRDAVCHCRK